MRPSSSSSPSESSRGPASDFSGGPGSRRGRASRQAAASSRSRWPICWRRLARAERSSTSGTAMAARSAGCSRTAIATNPLPGLRQRTTGWPYPRCLMARNDPTDTGGLFVGRRPGTAPLRYRTAPQRAGERRRRADETLAAVVLVLESLVCLTLWGPQPVAWLWVGSQVDYRTGSVTFGIAVAFAGLLGTLMLTLALAAGMDRAWRILRRAAGHEQQEGVLGRIFAVTAIVALILFSIWFWIIEGPAPTLAPR